MMTCTLMGISVGIFGAPPRITLLLEKENLMAYWTQNSWHHANNSKKEVLYGNLGFLVVAILVTALLPWLTSLDYSWPFGFWLLLVAGIAGPALFFVVMVAWCYFS